MKSDENIIKGGRPKKDSKRANTKGICFTKKEYKKITATGNNAGRSVADYIRHHALSLKLLERVCEKERQNVRILLGIANNINQLIEKAHLVHIASFTKKLQDLLH